METKRARTVAVANVQGATRDAPARLDPGIVRAGFAQMAFAALRRLRYRRQNHRQRVRVWYLRTVLQACQQQQNTQLRCLLLCPRQPRTIAPGIHGALKWDLRNLALRAARTWAETISRAVIIHMLQPWRQLLCLRGPQQ